MADLFRFRFFGFGMTWGRPVSWAGAGCFACVDAVVRETIGFAAAVRIEGTTFCFEVASEKTSDTGQWFGEMGSPVANPLEVAEVVARGAFAFVSELLVEIGQPIRTFRPEST